MRFLVQHQASVDDAVDVDYASELSKGGLFISTSKHLEPKSTLHVQFAPKKDAHLVSAFCRVKEVRADGFSAEFVSLDAESEQLIAAALA
ncbi:MAG: PilZ domain-containing protein [Archangium sp.]